MSPQIADFDDLKSSVDVFRSQSAQQELEVQRKVETETERSEDFECSVCRAEAVIESLSDDDRSG
jgi:hypothetical protein